MTGGSLARSGPAREAVQLSLAYVALCCVLGVHLPYWPVWLAHRGMDAKQIGLLLGVFTWARLTVPWVGSWADRSGRPARLAGLLAAAHLACFAAFAWTESFMPLLLLSVAAGLAYAPITPLIDGIAVGAAAAGRIDYGRVRLWGSAAFVLASMGAGFLLEGRSPSLVLGALLVAAAGLYAATLWLPRRPPGRLAVSTAPAVSTRALLALPNMIVFLSAVAFLMGSHAVLYGFGTQHWLAIGIPKSAVGWLWAWGVIAEVALFAIGRHLVARLRPTGLIVLAGVGGLIRWPLLVWVESFPVIMAVQTLHGFTFAALHLGTMSWIRDAVDPSAVQRTTALYVAISTGFALGLGMPLAGVLFEHFAGRAYYAMAIASGIGLFYALRLLRAAKPA